MVPILMAIIPFVAEEMFLETGWMGYGKALVYGVLMV
jgi:hypothetical protein